MLTRASWLIVWLVAATAVSAQDTSYEYQERVVVESTVEDVMSRPEFRRLADFEDEDRAGPGWLERVFDRIAEWIEAWLDSASRGDGRDTGSGFVNLVYGIAFVIVIAALAFIIKAVLDSAHARELATESARVRLAHAGAAPGETSPDEFWARAQALAASGDEKLAIRELLLGAMSTLEREGRIRHRRGLTNRDYLWAAPAASRSSLATIIAWFERVYFGRRRATGDGFRECADAYRASFAVPTDPETT